MLNKSTMNTYKTYIAALEPEIRACGDLIRDSFGNIKYSNKSQFINDAVTEIDLEVEKRIKEKIVEIDPGAFIVGEELGGERQARHWLIDPIDGTMHFTRGIPMSTIMIALIEDSIPVLGIIYVASEDTLYSAYRGGGAYKNHEKIHVSDRDSTQILAAAEVNLDNPKNAAILQRLATRMKLMNLACAGYEFTLVADGRAEARVCIDPRGKDYDFAPGAIIVQEAGGVVKHLDGSDYTTRNNNFIAASSIDVYQDILEIITA